MATKAIHAVCAWCEDEATFDGPDPDEEWRQSGWMIHLTDEGELEYCGVGCAISAMPHA